ncbi:MAG: metallophosphoesterase family protein [Thermomicrobiales bacterium]
MDNARIYAIGDLHGHYRELRALYGQLLDEGFQPARDRLIFLGDYVDSGPDARLVVQQMIAWQRLFPHWGFLLGNHEEMMLEAQTGWDENDRKRFSRWWSNGGDATWRSYAGPDARVDPKRNPLATIDPAHLFWMSTLPRAIETNRYIFVHAGLRPGVPLAANDPDDMLWIRDEFIRSDFDWGKVIVYGHTPVKEPLVMANKICLNTMPRNTGKLTAVRLDDDGDADPVFVFQPEIGDASVIR